MSRLPLCSGLHSRNSDGTDPHASGYPPRRPMRMPVWAYAGLCAAVLVSFLIRLP
jgi:hypothetical protein